MPLLPNNVYLTVTRPFFSKERVTDLILYERKAATALHKMQERFDTGLAVDFQVRPFMAILLIAYKHIVVRMLFVSIFLLQATLVQLLT